MLIGCKPEAYVGPLDSPIGNWEGARCEYYFNGEMIAEADSSTYSAITFYKDGLCCIEGIKGAFPYTYDPQSNILQVDSTFWEVQKMHSEEMILKFLEKLYPASLPAKTDTEGSEEDEDSEEESGPEPDSNGIILPIEYRGVTISADENDYFYLDSHGNKIYCTFEGKRNADGLMIINLWYDSRIDHYIPLIRSVEKK